jgi:hypothetical protein
MLMYGAIHDLFRFIKDGLCSVAMVAVKVENEYPFPIVHQFLHGNGNVIKEAKA